MKSAQFAEVQAAYLALGERVLLARRRVRDSLDEFDRHPPKPRVDYDELTAALREAEDLFLPVRERYWAVCVEQRKDAA